MNESEMLDQLDEVFEAQVRAAKDGDSSAASVVLKYRVELEKARAESDGGDWFPASMGKVEIVEHLQRMLEMANEMEDEG